MSSVTIDQFLTEQQIEEALELFKTASSTQFATQCAAKIITPNLAEINRKLGQENDAMYLAFACQYVFTELQKRQ